MTIDEKVRYGMLAVSGAAVVLATMGIHIGPLDSGTIAGAGEL